MIEEAKSKLNQMQQGTIMIAFDMIGQEYLGNEAVYDNNIREIYNMIEDFNLPNNEIIEFIIDNENYNEDDEYIIFNGHDLWSIKNLDYVYMCLRKHMNQEVANFLLDELIILNE